MSFTKGNEGNEDEEGFGGAAIFIGFGSPWQVGVLALLHWRSFSSDELRIQGQSLVPESAPKAIFKF